MSVMVPVSVGELADKPPDYQSNLKHENVYKMRRKWAIWET
jgi:hypothetical protein